MTPTKRAHALFTMALTAGCLTVLFGAGGCAKKEDQSLMDAAPPPKANAKAATPDPNDHSVVAGPSLGGSGTAPAPTPAPAKVSGD